MGRPHILIFPYPAHGHMLSHLDLTHQLALHGFTITILVTPKNLSILSPLLSTHPNIQTLALPLPSHAKLPTSVEHVKDIGIHGNFPVICALYGLYDPIVNWFNSHPSPPVAIISDFFLGWTSKLADQLGIPRITYNSCGAFLTSIFSYCWPNLPAVRSVPTFEFTEMPDNPVFQREHLPSIIRSFNESDPDVDLVRQGFIANDRSWACVFNTFQDLEGPYLDYYRRIVGHRRVYVVGPLSLLGVKDNAAVRGSSGSNSGTGVLKWLDGCPDGSVLYVCFGSQKLLSKAQMEALATGLEKSGVRFLWVVKMGTPQQTNDGYGVVPDGFQERVQDRGIVVDGWVPQVLVLNHKAVGVFLNHCGWNSVLEAVTSSVMILGWPMEADHFINARLIEKDVGVGVVVSEVGDSVPDPIKLSETIKESFSGDNDIPRRLRCKELRDKAIAAVREGGSSSKDLNEFFAELDKLGKSKA